MRKGPNVYKRKDGRWEARIPIGKTDGKLQYKSLYAKTYRQALQRKKEYEMQIVASPVTPKFVPESKPETELTHVYTFREATVEWLRNNSADWKQSTLAKYENYLDCYILPVWGDKAITDIDQHDYQELINNLKETLSTSSVYTINTILRSCLSQHPDCFTIPQNCTHRKDVVKPIEILTANEIQTLVDGCSANMDNTSLGIMIALFSGVRIGELCALQWADIDLQEEIIHIRRTVQRLQISNNNKSNQKTELVFGLPKNKKTRIIPIHPRLLQLLTFNYRMHKESDFVLSGNKQLVEPRTFSYRFKQFCQKNNLRVIKFHTVRHTFATKCIESGMDVKVLSEVLGHSSVKITMDRYVHPTLEYKKSQIGELCYFKL